MMLKLRDLLILALCFAAPAQAGLFSDDEAHKKIQLLQDRVVKLEALNLEEVIKQQSKAMMDLQSQLEDLKNELRKLRGQNEELAHGLQDAEKREKDFYVDLDTRLSNLESANTDPVGGAVSEEESRAYETASDLLKSANYASAAKAFSDFEKKYPASPNLPEVIYGLANAQMAAMDNNAALASYERLLSNYPDTTNAPEALFSMANCQEELKLPASARKTLKLLIAKYPTSASAEKARKQLAVPK
jgi:tol-pal system protein YbgF